MPIIGEIRASKELGYKAGNKKIWLACIDCGIERWVNEDNQTLRCRHCGTRTEANRERARISQTGRRASDEARRKMSLRRGDKSPHWKGGRIGDGKGYFQVLLYSDNPYFLMANNRGYVKEQRLVMANCLNRCLESDEIVHHKNGIRTDNRVVNLALVRASNHPRQTLMKVLQKRIRELEGELSHVKMV